MFEQLKILQPNLNPTLINMDFELAAIKAAQESFPNARVQGCYFHFKKNIVSNLGQHGFKSRYEKDIKFGHEVRMLMALAFIPPDKIVDAFEYFERNSKLLNADQQTNDPKLKAFVTDYFANHYIGKIKKNGKRGKPQFPVDLWNVHDVTVNGKKLQRCDFYMILRKINNSCYCLFCSNQQK